MYFLVKFKAFFFYRFHLIFFLCQRNADFPSVFFLISLFVSYLLSASEVTAKLYCIGKVA